MGGGVWKCMGDVGGSVVVSGGEWGDVRGMGEWSR
jgi:hypothetical protein